MLRLLDRRMTHLMVAGAWGPGRPPKWVRAASNLLPGTLLTTDLGIAYAVVLLAGEVVSPTIGESAHR
jgi:hypothetical protein